MTMKFNAGDKFSEAKSALVAAMKNEDEKLQNEAFENYLDALKENVSNTIHNQVNAEMMDRSILQNRGQNVLTSKETKFFNEVIDKKGFDDDSILPVTTQERIFEDLTSQHPLLDALQLQDLGAVTRVIRADPEFTFVWGKLFGPILGQVGASFTEETMTQLKGTGFAVIPNDMLELGPEWVERFVRAVLVESVSIGLERGFVIGSGQDEPVGLIKNVDAESGAVSNKTPAGVLTFEPGLTTIRELKEVVKSLSVDPKRPGKVRRVAGKIVMVVNPFDNFDIQAAATTQNANGVYVTNLPFNPQIVESEFVDQGTVIFFVKGQYLAAIAGGYKLKKFDQTLAMEDATLYTIKQFANGKPLDNNAAAVYTLAIADGVSDPAGA